MVIEFHSSNCKLLFLNCNYCMCSIFTQNWFFYLALLCCQILTNLNKIVHTYCWVCNTVVGRLRPRSAREQLHAKPKRLCFCNTCNEPNFLYRDDGSPQFRRQTVRVGVRTGAKKIRVKNLEFCSMGIEPHAKKQHFRVLGVHLCAQPTGNSFTPNQW